MDKKTFISELEQALSVLQEEELNDIISEYEQHIDMKRERGLTEEEAIADFGSLDELAGEILEAYHVRADYAVEKKRRWGKPGASKGEPGGGKAACVRLWMFLLAGVQGFGNFLLRIGGFWKKQGLKLGKEISDRRRNRLLSDGEEDGKGWSGKEECKERGKGYKEGEQDETMEKEGTGKRGRTGKRGLAAEAPRETAGGKGLGSIAGDLFRGGADFAVNLAGLCIRIVLWGIRMAWNAGWIGFALCCGGFGLFSLYGLGMLAVLLMQGYPLAGVTLGCLGLVMCFFSAGCLGMTFLWRRKGRENGKESAGEGQKQWGEKDSERGPEARTGGEGQQREEKDSERGPGEGIGREEQPWEEKGSERRLREGTGGQQEEKRKGKGQQETEGDLEMDLEDPEQSCQKSREEDQHA